MVPVGRAWVLIAVATGSACSDPPAASDASSSGDGEGTSAGTTSGSVSGSSSAGDSVADGATAAPFKYDVAPPEPTGGAAYDACKASDPNGMVGPCGEQAPPGSFEPAVQWSWRGSDFDQVVATPLVVELGDDNGDGAIDLCDVPDVIVVAFGDLADGGRIVVLSGDDGHEHFSIGHPVDFTVTPAVGDVDGDGIAEIVTVDGNALGGEPGHLVMFEHDGELAWRSPDPAGEVRFGGPALADLDGDGGVEILMGDGVYGSDGALRWTQPEAPLPGSVAALPTAADLDHDGDLEVVFGRSAYHDDGTPYYVTDLAPGFAHVGDFDDDAFAEIVVTNQDGLALVQHDGEVAWQAKRPTDDPPMPAAVWLKPGTIHDFDGDGRSEFATGSANHYAVYEIGPGGPAIVWQAQVQDYSGSAGGTAFDFDGNGVAEAMYADEAELYVFDGAGAPLFTTMRESGTGVEYPVVADIDDDGSAEILVVSNFQTAPDTPAVVAIRDVADRWIPARRIWNQHTYHVTNVREDGTVPSHEPRAWQQLNTFRTNSQIEAGRVCRPAG